MITNERRRHTCRSHCSAQLLVAGALHIRYIRDRCIFSFHVCRTFYNIEVSHLAACLVVCCNISLNI